MSGVKPESVHGKRNHKYEYERSGVKLESVQCGKDLDVTIAPNLKFSQE